MFDIIDGGLAVVTAALGWQAGRAKGEKKGAIAARRELETAEPKPICGCGHHYALHYRQAGEERCGHVEMVLKERGKPKTVGTGWGGSEYEVVYDHEVYEPVTCTCVHYTGPEPMPRYVS